MEVKNKINPFSPYEAQSLLEEIDNEQENRYTVCQKILNNVKKNNLQTLNDSYNANGCCRPPMPKASNKIFLDYCLNNTNHSYNSSLLCDSTIYGIIILHKEVSAKISIFSRYSDIKSLYIWEF